jgi:transposase
MLAEILFSSCKSLVIDALELQPNRISLTIHSYQEACCPDCAQPAHRIHSHYTRKFADVPWGEVAVRIFFRARRFFCDQQACERRTFTEQMPSLIAPFAQRTHRLAAAQRTLGFALGGEAGARTAAEIGMGTSPDTLLRLVRNAPHSESPTPRILGVDDWAFRKGRDYGTILIDVEKSRPIDLLPDRTLESLAQWLKDHPGVEIITRDRASAYAEAATVGAPEATQVADRFHLLLNLREVLERFFDRHQADLRKVRLNQDAVAKKIEPKPKEKAASVAMAELYLEREKRRQARFEEARALKHQGLSRAKIARQLQMSVNTVKRYLRADEFPIRT